MGFGINSGTWSGNIVRDPKYGRTQQGKTYLAFDIAIQRPWVKDKNEADFFRITLWDKTAESFKRSLVKGTPVLVRGAITIERKKNDDGTIFTMVNIRPTYFTITGTGTPRAASKPPVFDDDGLPY